MSNELRLVERDHRAERTHPVYARSSPPRNNPPVNRSHNRQDQVSLSRAYRVIRHAGMESRLLSLEVQVANETYLIPPAHISRSLIASQLQAA